MTGRTTHIVNVSGGKDSATVALIARDRGQKFDLWMADTGNESPITVDYAHYLADFLGKPLNVARADFSRQLAGKRAFVAAKWAEAGVPQDRIDRALEVLQPTGNPFLDLCLWKGRFPSRKAQFCTEWLKQNAMMEQAVAPALARGPVVQWLGVRRDESLNRRNAAMFQRVTVGGKRGARAQHMLLFRPIIHWTAENVFGFAAARGLKPNPLYLQGFGRVGCFPCINASKAELSQIGRRYPEAVDRLTEWEGLVAEASKRGAATFFASDVTPEAAALGKRIDAEARAYAASLGLSEFLDEDETDLNPAFHAVRKAHANEASAKAPWPKAPEVFDWAKTTRGGKQ